MEIQSPIYLLALIVFVFFSTLIILKLKRRRSINPSKSSGRLPLPLPPGPWKLPLIGNMHNLIGDAPHRLLHQLAQKHGPLMQLQLGELSVVVVSSPDAAKQVLKTQDLNFASRPPIMATEIFSYRNTNIAFAPHGDYWRQLRKICTLELLSAKRVHSFRSLRHRLYLDLTKWIASMEGSPIDLTEELYASTYAFIVTAALGEKTQELEALLPVIKEAIELASGFDVAELFPSIKLIQKMSGLRRKLVRLHNEADRLLDHVIHQHKSKVANSDEDTADTQDLLDVLLKLEEDGLELPLTTDNIKAVIIDMLSAGSETATTVMDWAMAEMLRNPNVYAKAQEEVRQVFDEKGYVEESRIHELKYFKSVVKETLRLHPPLPLLLPRRCGETCEINGYEIAADAKIMVNAWGVNRDPNYWENADCFEPERFGDREQVDYKGNHFEYIPFGAGRRMCPGISFGIANVELPLAMLVYHFDWKVGGGIKAEEMDMTEGFGVTARRNQHLCVVPIITRPLPI